MVVGHEELGHRGAFVIEKDGKRLAEMTYTVAGTRVIIDHTSVDDSLRGTGAGRALVQAAVEWARAKNQRLLPLCPYARSVFDKTPEYRDVLA
jgi:predicted GNAT family acetyltransferase